MLSRFFCFLWGHTWHADPAPYGGEIAECCRCGRMRVTVPQLRWSDDA